jgi:hypothetical protein
VGLGGGEKHRRRKRVLPILIHFSPSRHYTINNKGVRTCLQAFKNVLQLPVISGTAGASKDF